MTKDLLRCFHCGQIYRIEECNQKKSMICVGCGLRVVPILAVKRHEKDTKGFCVLLGYFAIVALLGSLGGAMLMQGWNFWVTFAVLGGIIYLVGKIFMGTYKITGIVEYGSDEIIPEAQSTGHTIVFDRLVIDAIKELPQNIQDRLSNVSIVVEDRPTSNVLEKLKITPSGILLGLFEGIPLNKKSVWHSGTMPERITIFQKNIESLCHSEEEIKKRIKNVVRHELAHFIGFTEEEVRNLGY
ncbi:MAG: hypothetical protein DWB56_13185 [Candidatus Jettenia sp.]|uniref:Metallopeptidase family protein n=1 Tax=Candidatus Jettenia caeni TaxID=247490 RepID=I3IQ78_9BACT|nr:metallopeptidase family protein [Candidatus Jettenia sp. AMX1]MBC6929891.1 hypothetical protein [Candidatus Jettenia sp.]NUN23380.1 metallopeptidase family protein [Candidatus Jettenia caeni]WKZ17759.1 MAG: metallopeptidase family protein [Candidatus Jettenia sp. CY-1]KAA0248555.1 MAG: metallopeptidase family protein [Candidatus Jettenia sp. AMX1]MCE7881790.1 metallopeptidase family protein [Candidatus Jettenia sp. AMX1]